jgi:serine phosphatase RsbU (regulator of sigma subunit)
MAFSLERYMNSIRFKVLMNLGAIVVVFFLGYWVFFRILGKKNDLIEKVQKQELIHSVEAILETSNDSYEKIAYDYSVFSWMIDFIEHPDKADGEMTISHPQNIGVSFVRIYNLHHKLVYSDQAPAWKDTFLIPAGVFDSLYVKRKCSFFIRTITGLVQVVGSTVHSSEDVDRTTLPKGFVLFGKYWDHSYIKDLERIANAKITLVTNSVIPVDSLNQAECLQLSNYKGEPIGFIRAFKANPFLENLDHLNLYLNFFFIVFCFVLFVISYFTYKKLVVGPLVKVQAALNKEVADPIQELLRNKGGFGEVARLISWSFNQRDELKQKIEELNNAQQSMSSLNAELLLQKQEIEEQNLKLHFLNDEMQSQNEEIVAIAEGLHVANKEITDSISYASFIQNAVLAPSHELSRIFTEHFIFYMPKSIVSGDFYWFKEMRNGDRILAVADCTGHGLSGSLLSMLGISFLNQIVAQLEHQAYSAASILDSLKHLFIQSLHQKSDIDYVQDGMHIALCVFDKEGRTMQYATAFHSIFVVRKNMETGTPELIEYKGNRIPVGIYITDEEFINYQVEIQKDDVVYMYSDGIIDQFGGPNNKKYMTGRFKQFLLSISQLPITGQRSILINEFEKWKGNGEQTDDIIVVGVKVP